MDDFKTKLNALLTSDKNLSPAIPAPIMESMRLGFIPRSMLSIVIAAKREGLSLNNISSPKFLSQLSTCQGGVAEGRGSSSSGDIAAIGAGYHSISIKQLTALQAAGIDLDDLFSSITPTTPTTEAA